MDEIEFGGHFRTYCAPNRDIAATVFVKISAAQSHRSQLLELLKMAIYNKKMDISVTEFKHHCLEIIRRVEKTGKPVAITRRGKVVARLNPSGSVGHDSLKPWAQLRTLGGHLLAEPGESALRDEDFEALR